MERVIVDPSTCVTSAYLIYRAGEGPSGGTGFIGARTLRYALEKGYHVRASVRSEQKAETLRKSLASFGTKLEIVLVPDILAAGAYDEAVKGVTYAVHIASPLPSGSVDDDLDALIIQPAISGTVEMLRSCAKESSVKRVVITSSTVAIHPFTVMIGLDSAGDKVYTPEDRAPDVEPPFPATFAAYVQSKIASLRAAEEWMVENKPSFDMITIHPSFVGGINDTAKRAADLLEGTNPFFLAPVLGKEVSKSVGANIANVVDVGDVAKAHIEALDERVQGNQAFLLTNKGGDVAWNDAKAVVAKYYPHAVGKQLPNDGNIEPHFFVNMDIEKTEKTFGRLKSFEDTIGSLTGQYLDLLAKEAM
ncbi:hypothetical protein LTR10_010159 [Elasticomyces elasticus]|nr:hypothetical protein LTR10_010159 [Elasticomyces elasticus]KAK4972064.1 hypothetical protein LTR42_006569 [Elasticomyces elasticus]